MRKRTSLSSRQLAIYGCALVLLIFTAFPFFWMISTAFKPLTEIFAYPPYFLPKDSTLANFARLFEQTRFLTYFKNSVIVSTSAVVFTMIIATAGAYSLTRFRYYGRERIASLILFTYMFAPIMIVIPFYVLIRKMGIANTHFALIMAYTAFCLPFSVWLLRAFFQSIPIVLEEAALTDGAGRIQAIVHVVLPLALPGMIATGIFTLYWRGTIIFLSEFLLPRMNLRPCLLG